MPDVAQRLREIREREQKATKGPWKDHYYEVGQDHGVLVYEASVDQASDGSSICRVFDDPHNGKAQRADTEFIAHSRSDIPFLLSRVEELEGALRKWGTHQPSCAVWMMQGTDPCSCGLDAALSAGSEENGKEEK